jgi:hypothetical protein
MLLSTFASQLSNIFTDSMRRLLSSLLLAFLVVGAQQSALVHEIGHGLGQDSAKSAIADSSGKAPNSRTTDSGAFCQKCFQFAHVAGAVAAHFPALLFLAAAAEPAKTNLVAAIAADTPQHRSRGPPIVL